MANGFVSAGIVSGLASGLQSYLQGKQQKAALAKQDAQQQFQNANVTANMDLQRQEFDARKSQQEWERTRYKAEQGDSAAQAAMKFYVTATDPQNMRNGQSYYDSVMKPAYERLRATAKGYGVADLPELPPWSMPQYTPDQQIGNMGKLAGIVGAGVPGEQVTGAARQLAPMFAPPAQPMPQMQQPNAQPGAPWLNPQPQQKPQQTAYLPGVDFMDAITGRTQQPTPQGMPQANPVPAAESENWFGPTAKAKADALKAINGLPDMVSKAILAGGNKQAIINNLLVTMPKAYEAAGLPYSPSLVTDMVNGASTLTGNQAATLGFKTDKAKKDEAYRQETLKLKKNLTAAQLTHYNALNNKIYADIQKVKASVGTGGKDITRSQTAYSQAMNRMNKLKDEIGSIDAMLKTGVGTDGETLSDDQKRLYTAMRNSAANSYNDAKTQLEAMTKPTGGQGGTGDQIADKVRQWSADRSMNGTEAVRRLRAAGANTAEVDKYMNSYFWGQNGRPKPKAGG